MFKFLPVILLLLVSSFFSIAKENKIIVAAYQDDVVSTVIFDGFSKEMSINVEYKYYSSFSEVLNSIRKGDADFAANVTFTEERATIYDYSSPTNTEFTYFFSNPGGDFKSARTVAVPKSTVFGELVKNYSANRLGSSHQIDIVEYDSSQEAVNLIDQGIVDGIVDTINLLTPLAKKGLEAQLLNNFISINPVSLITTKGKNKELIKKLESYVHTPYVQKKLRVSINQYQQNIRIKMLRDELKRSTIDLLNPIYFQIESVGEFAGKDEEGKVTGLTPQVITQVCTVLGLDCQLSIDDTPWDRIYKSFLARKTDAISPVVPTAKRSQHALFTKSYYDAETILVKRKGYKDLVYKHPSELIIERIGVISKDYYHEVMQNILPQKKLHVFTSRKEMVDALLNNTIDYIPMSEASFNILLMDHNYLKELVIDRHVGVISVVPTAIGLTKIERHEALLPYLNRVLSMIDVDSIIEQHIAEPDWQSVLEAKRKFSNVIYSLSATFIGISILVLIHFNRLSNTDILTGLKNRRALYSRFSSGIPEGYTVVYFDIDGFKLINDNYGHIAGDNIIKEFSKNLKRSHIEFCYRIGGDEFIAIGKLTHEQLVYVIESLSTLSLEINSIPSRLTVSTGISHPTQEVTDIDKALHIADINMYQDKRGTEDISSH